MFMLESFLCLWVLALIMQSRFKLHREMPDSRWIISKSWWSAEGCGVASLRLS